MNDRSTPRMEIYDQTIDIILAGDPNLTPGIRDHIDMLQDLYNQFSIQVANRHGCTDDVSQ